ncbi:EIN3-binding F-box protein 1-like [Nymphaea colorata]|nr:EIN3-binding F-box protein 1-like [Nymphaea colorata]
MPPLVKYFGDEVFCPGGPFNSDFMDSSLMLSPSPFVDVFCPRRKRARISAPFIQREQEPASRKIVPSIDVLPDECLFEVFARLPSIRDRSACACVSKRWLMLQSSIRGSEFASTPACCGSVTATKVASATEKDTTKAALAVKDANGERVLPATIEVDGGDEEEEAADCDAGHLTRSLQGKKATDVRLAAISVGAAKLGGLGKLLIRGSNAIRGVTDVGLSAIARGCPSLRVLSLWNLSSVSDKSICEIAEGCHLLEKLDLCHCPNVSDKALLAIAAKCPNLSSVSLESCPLIGNEGLPAIGRSCLNLRSISIKDCPLVGDQGIAGLVASAAALSRIKLQGVNISDVSLAVIGHYGKSVAELSFTGLQHVGERGFWALGNAHGLNKLRTLHVSSCNGMTDMGLEAVGVGCPVLKHLCLRRCCLLSDSGLRAFARTVVALENLLLEECNWITQTGVLDSFSNCKANLKSLSLVKCVGINDVDDGLSPLPLCASLHSLTIRGCSGFGSRGVAVVGKVCPNLQNVDFSGVSGLRDSDLLSLTENCRAGLTKLNLNGCVNLTDDAIIRLVMFHGGSLRLLNLGGCRSLTDESLKVILANCPLLQELNMSGCSITDQGFFSFNSSNKGLLPDLQILSLSGCSQVSEKSLQVLGYLSGSLVGLNLQHCNLISSKAVGWLGERMWGCDILS